MIERVKIDRFALIRRLCWVVLFSGLIWNIVLTLDYFDPPATDPLMVRFVKSGDYLPSGDTFTVRQIVPPVSRILEEDRRSYRWVFFVSVLGLAAAVVVAAIPRRTS
jgi:hypothetical protein